MPTKEAERVDTRQRSNSGALATDWSSLLESPRRARSTRERPREGTRRPFFADGKYRTFEDHQRWDADYRQANALQPRSWANRPHSADHRRPNAHVSSRVGVLAPEPPPAFDYRPSSDPSTSRFEELTETEQLKPPVLSHPRANSDTQTPRFVELSETDDLKPPASSTHRPNSDPQIPRFEAKVNGPKPSAHAPAPRFEELVNDLHDLKTGATVISEDSSEADDYEAPPTLHGQAQDCIQALSRAVREAQAISNGREADSSTSGIAERCEDSLFRLKVWISESNITNAPAVGDDELDGEVLNLSSSILYRLHARVASLTRHIGRAGRSSSKAFSFAEPPQQTIDNDASDAEPGKSALPNEKLTPVARIQQDLKQVELQIRTLRRMTRSLRVVQKDDFAVAVMKHVSEVKQLFGEEKDCKKWREEIQGKPADAALKDVREMVGVIA